MTTDREALFARVEYQIKVLCEVDRRLYEGTIGPALSQAGKDALDLREVIALARTSPEAKDPMAVARERATRVNVPSQPAGEWPTRKAVYAAIHAAAMSLPPSGFGSHRAVQAATNAVMALFPTRSPTDDR